MKMFTALILDIIHSIKKKKKKKMEITDIIYST